MAAAALTLAGGAGPAPRQQAAPAVVCALTVSARTSPALIMRAAGSLGGVACGRTSVADPAVILAPAGAGGCGGLEPGLSTVARKTMTISEGQAAFERCSPVASGTHSGHVTALIGRGIDLRVRTQ